MAETNTTPSLTGLSGIGGARLAGVRSTSTQNLMNKNKEAIKKVWNLQGGVEDAFPASIKPVNLGSSTLKQLRSIATREQNLAVAQVLFTNVCKDSNGIPVPFSHRHACSILDTLKSGGNSTPIASKTKDIKDNTTKSANKATSPDATLAKVPQLIAPSTNLKAPFSLSKPGQPSLLTAPEVSMASYVPIVSTAALTIPMKRLHTENEPLNKNTAKKLRKSIDPLGPAIWEHSTMEKNLPSRVPKDKINSSMPSSSKTTSGDVVEKQYIEVVKATPTAAQISISKTKSVNAADNEEDDLDKRVAKNRRANAAFFAGSEARQAIYATDTIRVAHPEDIQSFILGKEAKAPPSSLISVGQTSPSQNWLKYHCLSLHESVSTLLLGTASLHKIAHPNQEHLVEQAIQVLDRVVNQLKTGMEAVFAESI